MQATRSLCDKRIVVNNKGDQSVRCFSPSKNTYQAYVKVRANLGVFKPFVYIKNIEAEICEVLRTFWPEPKITDSWNSRRDWVCPPKTIPKGTASTRKIE